MSPSFYSMYQSASSARKYIFSNNRCKGDADGNRSGLGAAIVEKFAAEGAHVAINYVSREGPAKELAEQVTKQYGVKAVTVRGDCGVAADCQTCVRETIAAFGGIDIIIGNAVSPRDSQFWYTLVI